MNPFPELRNGWLTWPASKERGAGAIRAHLVLGLGQAEDATILVVGNDTIEIGPAAWYEHTLSLLTEVK